jgi:hypothetical protein
MSGIRHIRDGMVDTLYDLATYGISATISVDPESNGSSAAVTKDKIKSFYNFKTPRPIDSVEGPNEPDLFWSK